MRHIYTLRAWHIICWPHFLVSCIFFYYILLFYFQHVTLHTLLLVPEGRNISTQGIPSLVSMKRHPVFPPQPHTLSSPGKIFGILFFREFICYTKRSNLSCVMLIFFYEAILSCRTSKFRLIDWLIGIECQL